MSNKSDCLIVGYDESDNHDYTCLTVTRRVSKDRMVVVKTIFGKEAEELYKYLIKDKPAQVVDI